MSLRSLLSFLLITISLGLFVVTGCNSDGGQTIPDMDLEVSNFGLIDHQGDFFELYKTSAKAVVIYVQGNACPIVRNGIADLRAVREKYQDKGVDFVMINSNLQDDRESIAKEAEEFNIDFPILDDHTQLVGEALQLSRTAEVLVLDPETWTIVFRGPVNDRVGYESQRPEAQQNYLADALNAQLAGEMLVDAYVRGKGCLIKFLEKDRAQFASISYEKDVAPILINKCTKCHHEGGIAPWSMKDYETIFGWSAMMKEVLKVKRMPPWQADPHYGVFDNDLSLTNEETRTLVHWIEAGAPREGGEDPLKKINVKKDDWILGEPELVVTLNEEKVPANGVLDYRYQQIDLELEKDVWATAIQVVVGNKEVLHHVLVDVTYPKGFDSPIDKSERPFIDGYFAGWAPGGLDVEIFPENSGRALPKGSKLTFQLHYTTNGKAQSDITKLGIYLTEEKPEKEYIVTGPADFEFQIPPYESDYYSKAIQEFPKSIVLHGMSPHMHFRGKAMRYTAIYPDGGQEILLNVPNYNFNWQRYYRLKEPKKLPAGTKILVNATFDNSTLNTFNPDPGKLVTFGEQTFDEMMIGFLTFVYADEEGQEGSLSMK